MAFAAGFNIVVVYLKLTRTVLCLSVLLLLNACETDSKNTLHEFSGQTMGTYYRVALVGSHKADLESLQTDVEAILVDVNNQMSTYIPDSQISMFNQSSSMHWIDVSTDLATVSQKAKEIYTQSDGFFDPTLAPLVNLWRFGPQQRPVGIPSDNEIKAIKDQIGAEKLQIRSNPAALKKSHPALNIDLSSIAKGFAVDKLAKLLVSKNHQRFLIDIGGELRASGHNVDDERWRVGIEKPEEKRTQSVHKVIFISDKSIATSGSYRNYFEQDKIRYSHIINPKKGAPITHKLVSVSVVADDCMTADGYATALMVLGPEAGYDFALQYGLAVYMIEKKGDEFVVKFSPQMKPFLE